jgi:putative ABC transport system substrate-binding protein
MTLRRREFITALGGAAAWPLAAWGQQAGKQPIIGFLHGGSRNDGDLWSFPFRQGLGEVGFIEGRNVAIEYRYAENRQERYQPLATELVERRVSVIAVSPADTTAKAVKAATALIPVVFLSGPDPVRTGLVPSLNRPGGNLTGVTLLSNELTTKRLGLLHDLAPQATAVALLLDGRATSTNPDFQLRESETAARNFGLRIIAMRPSTDADFDAAFETAVREGAGALLVSASGFLINHRDQVIALAARYKLPAIYQTRQYPSAGGLISYGPSQTDAYRQVGVYAGRILKGEKPSDLPVLLPTKFEFVVNLRTAKALGITIPPTGLAIADEIID